MKSILFAGLASLALAASAQAPQKIATDKSFIRFATRAMGAPMEGRFRKLEGTVVFDPAKPDATHADLEVDLASIDLASEEIETEARRKGWLNVEAFPKAKLTVTSVKPLGGNRYEAHGELTIKGTTRPLVAPFTLAEAGGLRTVEGEVPLKRLQYKIGEGPWADTDTVADEVVVRFRIALPSNR